MAQVFNVMIRDRKGQEFSLLVTTDEAEAWDLFYDYETLEEEGAIAAALLVDGEVVEESAKVSNTLFH
jgi:hypothetical protein